VTERHTLIAFLATLIAIVVLVVTGALMAANGKPAEALGIGGAVTGLIGVIGTFKPRTPTGDSPQPVKVTNPPEDPANVQEAPK
jgi:hypothetical protein